MAGSPSECSDCTSHSLFIGTDAVGVETAGGGTPVAEEKVPVWLGLNDERRFWAEDFRRIPGRCI